MKGTLAPQAIGVIHIDFEQGFIKAEVSILQISRSSTVDKQVWPRSRKQEPIVRRESISRRGHRRVHAQHNNCKEEVKF
jgi:ribosome-binding ATPase YchF (GTP1/OBG family)